MIAVMRRHTTYQETRLMMNNDVLRSVRYMLDISDSKIVEIIGLTGFEVSKSDVIAFMKKEEEEGYLDCSDEIMAHFLDGLVYFKRGKDESRPPQPIDLPITNNIVLKKLRVAFELKEDDMHAILKAAEFPVSKPELSALFRKVGHTNYRACGDQLLRNFLKGLTLRVRG
ncbi:hypothetical protein ALO95_02038 [Pseudomonas syringae pv. antirrhini]|uniref:DUF1456 family protein n=1 Tax=Pseudomonas syringae pv. antirrhini TaxID=251702 RepID=A0A0P9JD97_9PSED|nr:Uncharacterized protein ALO88_02018 [Pseudomonas syringae pv. antirrhini]KPW54901.1 Uncharacterized protein ALO86_04236 [Pseudomonas syringae pv. berberidis]KPX75642.1 Uncharacterized protein ALO84_02701 [Pseudomonas syringae pv. maculicola]KPY23034.1 Uncharacterized protein ALO54_00651 [Pseudomonas syringae pv. philadelphi]RMN45602.1 hypothetical protein ALQ58_100139 [Pseudomonas syringae pv. apii]RMR19696.1 hypothetical protein ALP89_02867 [Pseudomonas syringae pv. persicae]RMR30876.1 hy